MKKAYVEPSFGLLPAAQTDIIATSVAAVGGQDCEYADWAILF